MRNSKSLKLEQEQDQLLIDRAIQDFLTSPNPKELPRVPLQDLLTAMLIKLGDQLVSAYSTTTKLYNSRKLSVGNFIDQQETKDLIAQILTVKLEIDQAIRDLNRGHQDGH